MALKDAQKYKKCIYIIYQGRLWGSVLPIRFLPISSQQIHKLKLFSSSIHALPLFIEPQIASICKLHFRPHLHIWVKTHFCQPLCSLCFIPFLSIFFLKDKWRTKFLVEKWTFYLDFFILYKLSKVDQKNVNYRKSPDLAESFTGGKISSTNYYSNISFF